jgi:hypothetical protein
MDMRVLLLLAMFALPIALFAWARLRRREPIMSHAAARAGWEEVMAGAPLTDERIKAVAAYTVLNAYDTQGVVEQVMNADLYAVRLADGQLLRATRSKALWQRSVVLVPGQRVALLATRGTDRGTIKATL